MRSLSAGRHAGVDRDVVDTVGQRLVVELSERRPRQCIIVRRDAELRGDGSRRVDVVTRDHHDADAGGLAGGDGVSHAGARWIDHPLQPDEDEPIGFGHVVRVTQRVGECAASEAEHALPAGGHAACGVGDRLDVERYRPVVGEHLGAHAQHPFGRPLDEYRVPFLADADTGRVLLGRLERDLREHRVGGAHVAGFQRCGERRQQQRDLGGVAGGGQVVTCPVEVGLVREDACKQGFVQPRVVTDRGRFVAFEVLAVGNSSSEGVAMAGRPDLFDGHPVLGERAGLVGTDHRRAAQCLDRRESPDDRVASRHTPNTDGERDRDRNRKAFRHGGHRQRHGDEEHVLDGFPERDTTGEREHRRQPDRDADDPGEFVHPALQRGGGDRFGSHEPSDRAELGVRPGRDDHAAASTRGDSRSRVGHARPVRQLRVETHRPDVLGDRHRLTRQQRLVDLQCVRPDEAQIGRYPRTGLEQDDVARHEIPAVDLFVAAVADDARVGHHQLHQREHRTLGLAFLREPDHCVQHQHRGDHHGVQVLAEHHRDGERGEQDEDQRAAELTGEHQPGRCRWFLLELVRSVSRTARRRIRVAEAVAAGFEQPLDRVPVQAVPRHSAGIASDREAGSRKDRSLTHAYSQPAPAAIA